VNLGHVGFLAEAESDGLFDTVSRLVAKQYIVEERMTLDVTVRAGGHIVAETWALNEATVEKAARERMLEVICEVDERPLSRLGCDGVVCSTPTGSTAYAFSAGGPVVWPEVEALLMVPISAHALFAPPLVVSPEAVLAVEVISEATGAVLWCDGRRKVDLPPGARVEVRRGTLPVRLARLDGPGPRRAVHGPARREVRATGGRLAWPSLARAEGHACLRKSASTPSASSTRRPWSCRPGSPR
jgi:NAD+ kinase